MEEKLISVIQDKQVCQEVLRTGNLIVGSDDNWGTWPQRSLQNK